MKYFILISVFFITILSQSQEIQYFPQEIIVLSQCSNAVNKSDCFYSFLEKRVNDFIEKNKKVLNYAKKDTLKTGGRLILDAEGKIVNEKSYFSISGKNIDKKIARRFKNLLQNLEIKEIQNRKVAPVNSYHLLNFNYVVKTQEKTYNYRLIQNSEKYKGGIIEEIPRFPGCDNLNESEARQCFQKKIQNHIRRNFNYPKEAQRRNLSGRVSVIFIVSEKGEITKIRTRGPHKILEEDVVRIIKLLPNMSPGKANGVPVSYPYAIPITYKL